MPPTLTTPPPTAAAAAADDLTPRAPRTLLDELVTRGKRAEVELHLCGGGSLRGKLAGVGDDDRLAIAVLLTGGTAGSRAYVRVDQIAAVVVVDGSALAEPVRSRSTTAIPFAAGAAPTQLELSGALGARGESLKTALGRALPMTTAPDLDDDARRTIAASLPPLVDTLRAMSRDPMLKPQLDAIAGVVFAAAATPALRLEAGQLLVTAAAATPWTAIRFRSEIEGLLARPK